jgi:ribonuclease-3
VSFKDLEARLGHTFENVALLRLALTHRSITNETDETEHNERLEFLGDAVLQLIVSQMIFEHYAGESEGEMSKLRATAVNRDALAGHAKALALGPRLRLGAGERRSGGAEKPSLLADAFEAVVAAIHLDGGFEAAKAFVTRVFDVASLKQQAKDAKTDLQHYCQKMFQRLPTYRVLSETGPEHDRRFLCEVVLEGRVLGTGEGKSKKIAEQAAAAAALAVVDGGA